MQMKDEKTAKYYAIAGRNYQEITQIDTNNRQRVLKHINFMYK